MLERNEKRAEGRAGENREALGWVRTSVCLAARILLVAVLAVAALAVVQGVAGAQESVKDWDSVTEPQFDSAQTDAANRAISSAQEERDAAKEGEEEAGCTICAEAQEYRDAAEAADEETREETAALVDARAAAIVDAPADSQQQIDAKYEGLDTLENYAEEWSPESVNEGYADTSVVEGARSEVEEQASEVEASSGGGSGSSGGEDTAEDTTGSAPAGGSEGGGEGSSDGNNGGSGGDDGGNSGGSDSPDEGSSSEPSGGPLSSISSALSGSNLVSLLFASLIAIGVIYYLAGLLKEGVGARVRRIGVPQQAQAQTQRSRSSAGSGRGQRRSAPEKPSTPPEERRKPSPSSEDLHGDAGTVADRLGEGCKDDRRGGGDSEGSGGGDEASDGSAIADRLRRMRGGDADASDGSSASELDDLFFGEGEGDDEDEGR